MSLSNAREDWKKGEDDLHEMHLKNLTLSKEYVNSIEDNFSILQIYNTRNFDVLKKSTISLSDHLPPHQNGGKLCPKFSNCNLMTHQVTILALSFFF